MRFATIGVLVVAAVPAVRALRREWRYALIDAWAAGHACGKAGTDRHANPFRF